MLSVFVQYNMVSKCLLDLGDVATLKCVSRETKLIVCKYINEQVIIDTNVENLGIQYKQLPIEHVIDMRQFVKQLIATKRLYGNVERRGKFLQLLNNFTGGDVTKVWTEPIAGLSYKKQCDTIYFLLNCIQTDNIQHNIIIIYFLMHFISKLITMNKSIAKDKEKFLLEHLKIQLIIIDKCNEISTTLREEITMYPFAFIDRVIRKVGDVKRLIISLSR